MSTVAVHSLGSGAGGVEAWAVLLGSVGQIQASPSRPPGDSQFSSQGSAPQPTYACYSDATPACPPPFRACSPQPAPPACPRLPAPHPRPRLPDQQIQERWRLARGQVTSLPMKLMTLRKKL